MNQNNQTNQTAAPTIKTVLLRGLRGLCPHCAGGRLLRGYLLAHPSCSSCSEDFERLRADDGPAWLTILIVGHLSIPLLLVLLQTGWLDNHWALPLVILMTVLVTLALLPVCKGVFMSVLWLTKRP